MSKHPLYSSTDFRTRWESKAVKLRMLPETGWAAQLPAHCFRPIACGVAPPGGGTDTASTP